ncbi:hypothetical protein LAZ67_15000487 [Cordylochernes scorpioides]|uniref:Uncharacterized protein n=1 Tax=Cordylochernes scorpioides TaxID=51811 RepID=A0ABY6LA37_9ARAC|nr:hypothetical protein LAZ67_15000487 [Cordylochernes scorpioides]
MRVAPPRFNRLPDVTAISTAEPKNLEVLIRRIVREEVRKFMAPPSTFAAQDIDTPPPTYGISSINDQGYRRRAEGPSNNQRFSGELKIRGRSASTLGALATLHVIAETDAKLLLMPDSEEKQFISEEQERTITPWTNQEANYPKNDLKTRRHTPAAEDFKPPEELRNPLLAVPASHPVAAVRKTRRRVLWR